VPVIGNKPPLGSQELMEVSILHSMSQIVVSLLSRFKVLHLFFFLGFIGYFLYLHLLLLQWFSACPGTSNNHMHVIVHVNAPLSEGPSLATIDLCCFILHSMPFSHVRRCSNEFFQWLQQSRCSLENVVNMDLNLLPCHQKRRREPISNLEGNGK
jgi:hypothetical protein